MAIDYSGITANTDGLREQFPDITAIPLEQSMRFDEVLWSRLRMATGGTARIKTIPDLTRRVHEYIHVCSLNHTPVSPNALNRRFGRAAKALETSTQTMLDFLTDQGAVITYDRDGRHAVFSAAHLKELRELAGESFEPSVRRIMERTDQ